MAESAVDLAGILLAIVYLCKLDLRVDEDVIPVKDDNFLSLQINPVENFTLLYVFVQSILYFFTHLVFQLINLFSITQLGSHFQKFPQNLQSLGSSNRINMAEDEPSANDAQFLAELAARETQVNDLLGRKDKKGALNAALMNPPMASKDGSIKDANSVIVESVLSAITDAEVQGLVDGLGQEHLDVLMKYLYKTMGKIDKSINYALLLKMHALVTEKAGMGSIVRSLTDRKQV